MRSSHSLFDIGCRNEWLWEKRCSKLLKMVSFHFDPSLCSLYLLQFATLFFLLLLSLYSFQCVRIRIVRVSFLLSTSSSIYSLTFVQKLNFIAHTKDWQHSKVTMTATISSFPLTKLNSVLLFSILLMRTKSSYQK